MCRAAGAPMEAGLSFSIRIVVAIALLGALLPASGRAEKGAVDRQVEQPVREAIAIRQAAQQEQVKWREERQQMLALYEQLQAEQERLKTQKEALADRVRAARARVAAKEAQLAAIAQITDQVVPFLEALHQDLERRIEQDLPFLPAERRQRLENIATLIGDPGVAASEKFRKVFEALLIEAEYGNTIEVYQENIRVGGRAMLANIFRLGRLGLYYQSLDRQTCGFYNVAEAAWQPLDPVANRTLQTAIDIGAKRQPVEMLDMPLGRIAPR